MNWNDTPQWVQAAYQGNQASCGNNPYYSNQAIGGFTHVIDYGQYNNAYNQNTHQHQLQQYAPLTQGLQQPQEHTPMWDGSKPIVICGTQVEQAKDLEDAQRLAEEQAHKLGANAYILKPVRMVAPKRDVVTTDLP